MKALQAKYKDDKQRQQQEMMKFYQEHKVNPFASCLPLVLQLPVFISLFYMLRTDLKKHICGQALVSHYNSLYHVHRREPGGRALEIRRRTSCQEVAPGSAKFLFIPDITNQATGVVLVRAARALHRLTARLHAADDGDGGPQPAAHDDDAAARLRGHPLSLPGRSAGVLDHHESVDDRPAVLHPALHRTAPDRDTGKGSGAGEGSAGARDRRTASLREVEEGSAGAGVGRRRSTPPPPPRKKKKRSGRRR